MTEISQPWDGTTLGDASRARYDSDEWAEMYRALWGSYENCGVIAGVYQELWTHKDSDNVVEVSQGHALVYGRWYYNDADLLLNIVSATAGNWREDAVVLRCNWAAQTIRAVVKTNPSGENTAWDNDTMLTQTAGTTWEIPLAACRIDDTGDFDVTDLRQYVFGPGVQKWFGLADFRADLASPADWGNQGWLFDPTSVEIIRTTWRVPRGYYRGVIEFVLYFNGTGAPGGSSGVVWEVYGNSADCGDLAGATVWGRKEEMQVNSTNYQYIVCEEVDGASLVNDPEDEWEPGQLLEIAVRRVATDGDDDYANDAQFLGLEIFIY